MPGTVLIALHVLLHLMLSATVCHSNRKLKELPSNRPARSRMLSIRMKVLREQLRMHFYECMALQGNAGVSFIRQTFSKQSSRSIRKPLAVPCHGSLKPMVHYKSWWRGTRWALGKRERPEQVGRKGGVFGLDLLAQGMVPVINAWIAWKGKLRKINRRVLF